MINGRKISQKRTFNGKTYITDYKEYNSKLNARAVVLFLKTKNVSIRARIIDKTDFFIIYFDEHTFKKIEYKNIIVPSYNDVPDDFFEMVQKKLNHVSDLKEEKSKNWRDKQQDRFQDKHDGNFEVIKLENDVSTTELMTQTAKPEKKEVKDDIEIGINAALNHVENEFFRSCPKCGGTMKPSFMIVGGQARISIFQCKDCKFYIPRRL